MHKLIVREGGRKASVAAALMLPLHLPCVQGLYSTNSQTAISNKTPHVAITMCSLITFIVPAVMCLFNIKLFESMGYLGAICSYGFLTVYVMISVAAAVYLHKIRKLRQQDLAFSILAIGFMTIPILGSVGIPGSTLFPPPEAPYNLFPYLFLLYITVTCGWFAIKRVRSPRIVAVMQQGVDQIHSR
ncbi:hypothetical protein [Microseira wollei]|nr:hypothetical protein [Microseira wollei]